MRLKTLSSLKLVTPTTHKHSIYTEGKGIKGALPHTVHACINYTMQRINKVQTSVWATNVSTSKMQWIAVIAYINGIWQLGLNHHFHERSQNQQSAQRYLGGVIQTPRPSSRRDCIWIAPLLVRQHGVTVLVWHDIYQ